MNMVCGGEATNMELSKQQHQYRKALTSELLSQINRQREGSYVWMHVFLHECTRICILVIYDSFLCPIWRSGTAWCVCVFLFKHICFLDQRSTIWNCLSARVLQSSLSRVPYFQLMICSETIKNKVFCCRRPNQQISGLCERANKAVFTKLSQNSLKFSIWKWVSQLIDFDKLSIIQSKWILNWWENGEGASMGVKIDTQHELW